MNIYQCEVEIINNYDQAENINYYDQVEIINNCVSIIVK